MNGGPDATAAKKQKGAGKNFPEGQQKMLIQKLQDPENQQCGTSDQKQRLHQRTAVTVPEA
jgi:hypothetical protein